MKILQTIKYYDPSKGGMESVAKNIVDGVIENSSDVEFIIYANNHYSSFKKIYNRNNRVESIKESTPLILKSQPLSLGYPLLAKLISSSDVVHHHYPFPNMELALLRYQHLLKGKKFVITWHANINNSRWGWIGKAYNPLVKKLLDLASDIIVTSPQLAESSNILAHYLEKIKVVPLSFDPMLSNNGGIPRAYPVNRKFRLLFVGKLRSYKGIIFLLEAIKDLDVELYIVGDGEDRQLLVNKTEEINASHKVFFKSGLTDEQVAAIYQECDLFILPSINEAEAFGVVQLEAMSNGLPVINTSLKSGVPFVSLDSFSGLTVEAGNSEKLKNAINTIINSKELYETYSGNAVIRSKDFTREKMAKAYLNIYQS
ncbi:glycosyltransferase [Pedobacter sp. KBS0701]|uniref:glycosyltransferase n=1 Tax=Pedobacter sp. KBS0701 TaxID=2578106 RepID=UPI00110D3789|nr:glycosyltransferase [Pedobacter sp. KBS0701]QDW26940.1 glycosyltransferase [Pedobacter sp. KBS0701]